MFATSSPPLFLGFNSTRNKTLTLPNMPVELASFSLFVYITYEIETKGKDCFTVQPAFVGVHDAHHANSGTILML